MKLYHKNKTVIYVSILINIGLLTYVIILNNCNNKKGIMFKDTVQKNIKLSSINKVLEKKIMIPYYYNKMFVFPEIKLENLEGVNFNINEIISQNTLYMWYKEEHCGECISKILEQINTFSKDQNNKTIFVILTNKKNKRKVLVRQNYGNFHMPVFFIESSIKIFDVINSPILFTIDKERMVENLFIPDKSLPDITFKYLHAINYSWKNKYKSINHKLSN